MSPVNMHAVYKTKCGYPVRIYSLDGQRDYPVHGAFWIKSTGEWAQANWNLEGHTSIYGMEEHMDLVESTKVTPNV